MTLQGPHRDPASGKAPQQIVIFLHGWGADGANLIDLAVPFAPHFPDAIFYSPNAPQVCEANPLGFQWFSLANRTGQALYQGVEAASAGLNPWIDEVLTKHGLDDSKLAIVGFSQGTMTAINVALTRKNPVAAVVGYSGSFILPEAVFPKITAKPPICLIHGEMDEIVPFGALAHAKDALTQADVPVETHARPRLSHSIDMQGIDIAIAFLKKHLPA